MSVPTLPVLHRPVAWALAVITAPMALYGAWVALVYDGGTSVLIPFALVSIIGTALAIVGAARHSDALLGTGLLLQVACPIGFAWIAALAEAAIGTALLVRLLIGRVRAASSRPPHR
jgi:hypothetical protein